MWKVSLHLRSQFLSDPIREDVRRRWGGANVRCFPCCLGRSEQTVTEKDQETSKNPRWCLQWFGNFSIRMAMIIIAQWDPDSPRTVPDTAWTLFWVFLYPFTEVKSGEVTPKRGMESSSLLTNDMELCFFESTRGAEEGNIFLLPSRIKKQDLNFGQNLWVLILAGLNVSNFPRLWRLLRCTYVSVHLSVFYCFLKIQFWK